METLKEKRATKDNMANMFAGSIFGRGVDLSDEQQKELHIKFNTEKARLKLKAAKLKKIILAEYRDVLTGLECDASGTFQVEISPHVLNMHEFLEEEAQKLVAEKKD